MHTKDGGHSHIKGDPEGLHYHESHHDFPKTYLKKQRMLSYEVVPSIKAEGWPVTGKGWKEAHEGAQKHEQKKYGSRRFKALEKIISKRIPRGELAGSHTKAGQIIVSAKIPEKYHGQIIEHEKFEHARMTRKSRIRRTRTTKRR